LIVRWVLGLLVGALSLGCQSASEQVGNVASEITNASATTGDPAIVGLLYPVGDDSVVNCTGTLVGPHEVLTAAHCVMPFSPHAVLFGSNLDDGARIPISATRVHPGYDASSLDFDLARLDLGAVAPVEALRFDPSTDLSPVVGERVRLVGFGKGELAAPPHKRTGTARIDAVELDRFTAGPDPSLGCSGDSGGPALVDRDGAEVLIGVVSSGDWECAERTSFTRATRAADIPRQSNAGATSGSCSASSRSTSTFGSFSLLALVAAFWGRRR
jgi:secreted trypsin-like serine protease